VEDLTEKEQLEALRSWWADNGSYVMGGVIVGILIIFGWKQWQANIAETEITASGLYEDLMEASGRGNFDAAQGPAATLFSEYGDTPYAAQARLAMARMYMDSGRDQDAAEVLQPLVDNAEQQDLSMVARLRLAKILLYQDKAQAVVDMLKDLPESAFSARYNELLGDAYVALGSFAEAEAAYTAALQDNPLARTVDSSLVQLKINDLPLASELASAEPEVATGQDTGEPAPEEGDGDQAVPDSGDAESGDQ